MPTEETIRPADAAGAGFAAKGLEVALVVRAAT
jgi:hypothetical protein